MDQGTEPGDLPRGVVTFLLTEVVAPAGCTPDSSRTSRVTARQAEIAEIAEIIASVAAAHSGVRLRGHGAGDSVLAVFERPSDALAAAVDAQSALAAGPWDAPVAVRMAVHSGEAEFEDASSYGGTALNRCARLRDHARGAQVLVSAATAAIAHDRLPAGARLVPAGEAPWHGLSRAEHVHQLVHEAFVAPTADIDQRTARLGGWPTRLIGRAAERNEVRTLLERERMVTIAGAGGAGKTRLAHAVGVDLLAGFADVVWVELARVGAAADVGAAVARACGALEASGVDLAEVLISFLGARDVLIILDNCEHLVAPCAALLDPILRRAAGLRVLATSREPLGVAGEVTWRIPSMEIPAHQVIDPVAVAGCDAAALFVDRARAALPDFELDEATAVDVAAICRRLDGLPLAIELAAARLRSMTLRAIAAGLGDRFRLLTTGSRSGLPRQRALAASVDWSYSLCDEVEQRLLRCLAVFVAPFGVEAAEAVAADAGTDRREVFDLVCRLVDKSLVQRAGDRYRLLETIREFALDRAGDAGELTGSRDAHLRWFTDRAGGWRLDREVLTESTVREIGMEAPDLLAALEWSLGSESGPAVVLLWPLGRHWVVENGFAEVGRVADLVLPRFEAGSGEWLSALTPMAEALTLARNANWLDGARAILEAEPGIACSAVTRAYLGWTMAGGFAFSSADILAGLESSVDVGRREGNRTVEYAAAGTLAYVCAISGTVADADRWSDWLDRRLPPDAWARAALRVTRGYVALFRCEFDTAQRYATERARQRPPHLPSATLAGLVGIYAGDPELIAIGLDACEAAYLSSTYGHWAGLFRAAALLIGEGRLGDARVALEPASQPWLAARNQSPLSERMLIQLALAAGDIAAARERGATLRPLVEAGTAVPTGGPYATASLRLALADVATAAGAPREAEELIHDALGTVGADLPLVTVDALELLAVVLAQRNRTPDAARLVGAAEAFRAATGYRFRFPYRRIQIEALRPDLDDDELAAGAGLSLAETVALARGTRGKRGRPRSGWDSLTPTEARVVELVGRGCSNPEIARQLFMGVSTVKTHLVHVFAKLGLRSRTELAAASVARKERAC